MPAEFGPLLKALRTTQQTSQRRLAADAEVSARHLSYLETGKARPSREMVLLLGSALDVPLRERNRLLAAAGFAPAYDETPLDADAMSDVVRALDLLLTGHEPWPAVVMNRGWDVVRVNEGFVRLHRSLGGGPLRERAMLQNGPNLVDTFFALYQPHVRRPEQFLGQLMPRLRREAVRAPSLARRLERWIGPTPRTHRHTLSRVVVPLEIELPELGATRWFTTYTSLGTPADITTEELTIEMFHAADSATRELWSRQP